MSNDKPSVKVTFMSTNDRTLSTIVKDTLGHWEYTPVIKKTEESIQIDLYTRVDNSTIDLSWRGFNLKLSSGYDVINDKTGDKSVTVEVALDTPTSLRDSLTDFCKFISLLSAELKPSSISTQWVNEPFILNGLSQMVENDPGSYIPKDNLTRLFYLNYLYPTTKMGWHGVNPATDHGVECTFLLPCNLEDELPIDFGDQSDKLTTSKCGAFKTISFSLNELVLNPFFKNGDCNGNYIVVHFRFGIDDDYFTLPMTVEELKSCINDARYYLHKKGYSFSGYSGQMEDPYKKISAFVKGKSKTR
jgi:hypothetical protein